MKTPLVVLVSLALASPAVAEKAKAGDKTPARPDIKCRDALGALGVTFERASRRGIADGVSFSGKVGGVTYRSYKKGQALVLDCSLVLSLALAAPYFAAQGITSVRYSSAYQRRHIRGTRRLSRHSFGLAIDIHTFTGDSIGTLKVKADYEQGLGDDMDCVGEPLTAGGLILRRLWCQFARSELFRIVLDPDFDADHYNHFHVEALPWDDRTDLDLIAERIRRAAQATR